MPFLVENSYIGGRKTCKPTYAMTHYNCVKRYLVLLLTVFLAAACGKDKTTTETGGTGIAGASWTTSETIGSAGGEKSYTFTARAAWSARSNCPDWCEVLTESGAKGDATLQLSVAPNTSGASRTATIRIEAGNFSAVSFKLLQKATTDGTEGAEGLEINNKVDAVLSSYYLWNGEYNQMERNLSIPYVDQNNNFVQQTLMSMTTNTLDKKFREDYGTYTLYSYLARTPAGTRQAETRSGVNHGITKDNPTPSFGISKYAVAMFTDAAGNPTQEYGLALFSVIPGSPLDRAGFRRGDIIARIDGKASTAESYAADFTRLLAPSDGLTVSLTKNEMNPRPISVTATRLDPTPIIRSEVFEGTRVGYIVYEGFDAAYDNDLLAAVKELQEAGITDLVLDLRNNGGGHVISSNMLSTCIGGSRCQNAVYQFYRYNDDCMANWKQTSQTFSLDYDQTNQLFYEQFYYTDYFGVRLADYDLGLNRLYVLVGRNTASASEALINSLRGVGFPVTLIGAKTNGKNVGMNVFTWSDIDGYDYEFAPISFQGYNARKESVDPKGIDPDYAVSEQATSTGWYADFGPDEPLAHKALELIGVAGSRTTTRSAAKPRVQLAGPVQQAVEHPAGMLRTIDAEKMQSSDAQ